MITKNVKLYLGDGFPVRIPVSQFDTMWQFVFTIIHNSQPWQIPTGATAVLNGKKPDGNVFAFAGTIENNTVTVDADVQMTAVAGQTVCELSILSDGKTVGTANFILDVEEAPKSADDVVSDTVLDGYGMMVTNAVDDYIEQHPEVFGGDKFTQSAKNALLALLKKVAYIDENGQAYIDALESELFPPASLVSISAVYTQSGDVYVSDGLDYLKPDLVVTATYSDATTEIIQSTGYALSGTLAEGTNTVTVSFGGKTATFTVTVSGLYKLRSAFTSDGTSNIDTGFVYASGGVYSICGDFTITGINRCTSSDTVDYVFGTKKADSSEYIALQVIQEKTSPYKNYLWGMGIGYNAGAGLAVVNNSYRFVVVVDVANLSCSMHLRNVTAGTTETYSNTYSSSSILNSTTLKIGDSKDNAYANGFLGTVQDFIISEGSMSDSDITAYLEAST